MDDQHFVPEDNERSIIINIINPESYISPVELVHAIKPSDCSIDIIGIVKHVQNPTTIHKDGNTMNVFNFTLEIKEGIQVPICAWGEDILRIKPFIMLNNIIHLDGPFARPQPISHFTNGKKYLLTCRSNTILNTLGRIESDCDKESLENIPLFTNIDECLRLTDIDKTTVLVVAIKMEFRKENDKFSKKIGAVTDGNQKLIVYISECNDDLCLTKGEFVQIRGRFKENKSKIYFEVNKSSDITKLKKEKLSQEKLSSVTKMVKRKLTSTELDLSKVTNKSMKLE